MVKFQVFQSLLWLAYPVSQTVSRFHLYMICVDKMLSIPVLKHRGFGGIICFTFKLISADFIVTV
jgi:hypothetical protein